MVLLYPFATRVFCAEEHQYGSFKLGNFMLAQGFTRQAARQNTIQFRFVRFSKQHHVQRVVRDFTAVSREVIQTFGQRGLQVCEATNVGVGHFAQLRHIVIKGCQFDVESFIRTPARQHFHIKASVFSNGRVMLQRVDRIIGGTNHFHVHLLHDAARGEFILRQQFVALVPDFVRSRRRQQLTCNTKRTT